MRRTGVRIVLALVILLVAAIGYAGAVSADLDVPKMKEPVIVANFYGVSGPTYPNQFHIFYGWGNYDAYGYQVYIKDTFYGPNASPLFQRSADFGEKVTSFGDGGLASPDSAGALLDITHTYFITLKIFDKKGNTLATASSIRAPSGSFTLY